ncbi:MAG: helix-turn-helix domain-containing protein [Myxococcota bacterium]
MADEPLAEPFGRLLRFWRGVFGVSQEALAMELASSTRHISRLENSRVRPSQRMVERIAAHLDLGERDTHQLLWAAGYAPDLEPLSFDDPALRWTRKGAARALAAFDPSPAMVFDGTARVRMANRAWLDWFGPMLPDEGPITLLDYFEALFQSVPRGREPRNWTDLQCGVALLLHQESVITGEPGMQKIVEELVVTRGLPDDWARRAARFEPIATFVVPLLIEGEHRTCTHLTISLGQRPPAIHGNTGRMVLAVLLPAARGDSEPGAHPLLHTNFL